MRTIRTKVYKFNELSEQAKQKAINNWRNQQQDYQYYFDEIVDSIKAVVELFDLKTGREYTDIRTSHIDDNILNLKGVRLYKYIVNNYSNNLFTPTYIKSIDRAVNWKQFVCKTRTAADKTKYTQIYSKQKKDNCCVLTGICYDDIILQPIYDFLKHPDTTKNFHDLFQELENAICNTVSNTEEWLNSDEFITDEIEVNGYEFKIDGTIF